MRSKANQVSQTGLLSFIPDQCHCGKLVKWKVHGIVSGPPFGLGGRFTLTAPGTTGVPGTPKMGGAGRENFMCATDLTSAERLFEVHGYGPTMPTEFIKTRVTSEIQRDASSTCQGVQAKHVSVFESGETAQVIVTTAN